MAIPFNHNLNLNHYHSTPDWHKGKAIPQIEHGNLTQRAANNLYIQTIAEPVARSVQFLRDSARLLLKVPVRAIWTPVVLQKNWAERERAVINTKLTGYSFIQLTSTPLKVLTACIALATSKVFSCQAKRLLDTSDSWISYLDGSASRLEALKEEGCKKIKNREEYESYKNWIYGIDPMLCRKDEKN